MKNLQIEANTEYLLSLGAEFGLGLGVREFRFARAVGREYRADVAWPGFRLLVELEGGVYSRGRHVRGPGYEDDCEKYSLASIMGFTLIRVTYRMVDDGRAYNLMRMAAERILKKEHEYGR